MRLDKLGRYEILQELGSGVLGSVWLAHDPERDKRVVVKTLDVISRLTPEEQTSAREALSAATDGIWRLAHPCVISLLEVHEVDGVPCYVIEYVDGQPLSRHATRGTLLPRSLVVELIARAAEALDHAHANGIVHGDVKPQNLLRVGDSGVKITDFQLAAVLRSSTGRAELPGEAPAYMSPEQVRGKPLDSRSDLFSLTTVLYELLTGEKPFPGDSPSSVVYRIVHEAPRDPAKLSRPVHGPLRELLLTGLARQPEDRFASGARMAQGLRDAGRNLTDHEPLNIEETGADDGQPVEVVRQKVQPRRLRPVFWSVMAFLALAAVGFYVLRGSPGVSSRRSAEVLWEVQVRTEPAGLEVSIDGIPLELGEGDLSRVQFRPEGPFGTLTVEKDCRSAYQRIRPADAGAEIVLVLDALEMTWSFNSQVPGAELSHNGTKVGAAPAEVRMQLCQENQLKVEAPGFRPATVEIPAGATPLDARKLLYGLELERIPIGKLLLEENPEIQLVYYVDDKRAGKQEREFDLEQGEHRVRLKNEYHFIDDRRTVRVVGGETVSVGLGEIELATLVVQAFPSNCKVFLRKPGGRWRYIDETPASRRVAAGPYEVKVELNPTGETAIRKIELMSGGNAPVRVSFGNR